MVYSSELWRLFHLLMLFRLQSFRAKWNLKSLPTLIRGSWLCFCCLLQSHVRLFCDPMGCGLGFPDGSSGKEHTCRKHERCRFDPWVRKIPWRRSWQPTPVFVPGESHGQRSLAGSPSSPSGCKESDTTEATLHGFMDCSLPGSSVHGVLQARILKWVAISFCRGSSNPGIKPMSPALQADSFPLSHLGSPPGSVWRCTNSVSTFY